jgi:hypothetical protein
MTLSSSENIALNDWLKSARGKNVAGYGFEVLFQNFPGGAEENHENLLSG